MLLKAAYFIAAENLLGVNLFVYSVRLSKFIPFFVTNLTGHNIFQHLIGLPLGLSIY
jgi:hypothetical protein